MSDLFSFLFFLGIAATLAVIVFLFVLRRHLLEKGLIARSLNLELLSVRLLQEPPQGEQSREHIREKIALMEQLYANLHGIKDSWWNEFFYGKPQFVLELAVPHAGEELSFYIAVPRAFAASTEKIIQGIFPDAQAERSRDYNIFHPEGSAAGAEARLKINRFYPIRTYQKLEGDPMRELTNAFTKLARKGEGAALQIVARRARARWTRTLREHARLIYQGKPPHTGKGAKIVAAIDQAFRSGQAQSEKEKEEQRLREQQKKLITPSQEEKVRSLEGKAGKALFETNIRLVSSAADRARAESILQGLAIAFEQFSDPNCNRFVVRGAEGGVLKNLLFRFSFRNFDERSKAVLSTEELTSLFHFPNVIMETPKLRVVKAREAPPPPNLPQEGLLLGYNVFRGEESRVYLTEEDRRRHLYIIGQTGAGKSVLLRSMAIQVIQSGKGGCVIDPHGDLVEDMLGFVPRHRMQDVVYFNPGDIRRPMGLNMLEYDPSFPEQKTFIVNELLSIFDKLYNMSIAGGPIFEQYFRNSTMLVMEDPASGNTLLDIQRVLADKAFRDRKLASSKNIVVNQFWTEIAEKAGGEASLKDIVPYIASKIDNFITNEIMRPIVVQEKSAFSFREVMDNQKILLVNLSKGRLGDLNSSFIGLILVGKLLMAALSRVDTTEEKRKDFYLYIDEFQNVTTDSIATILSEARKYRLDLTMTHQFIGQLKEEIKKAVFGNVGSIAAFRIGSDDAEFVAKQFKPIFGEQDLLNIDNRNCYVKLLVEGQTAPPFNMKTYSPEQGDREIAETASEISRQKYGRPREEVEREIVEKYR